MAEKATPDHIKERIREILMEDGWSLRKKSGSGIIWAFAAEDRLRIRIGVGQSVGKEDQVVIEGVVTLGEATTNRIAQLPEDERNNFLWDLRFELLRTNLEFKGIQLPLKRVGVSERIFLDALTKDAFLQRASEIRKGVLIINWMIQRKFAQQPPRKQLGFQR